MSLVSKLAKMAFVGGGLAAALAACDDKEATPIQDSIIQDNNSSSIVQAEHDLSPEAYGLNFSDCRTSVVTPNYSIDSTIDVNLIDKPETTYQGILKSMETIPDTLKKYVNEKNGKIGFTRKDGKSRYAKFIAYTRSTGTLISNAENRDYNQFKLWTTLHEYGHMVDDLLADKDPVSSFMRLFSDSPEFEDISRQESPSRIIYEYFADSFANFYIPELRENMRIESSRTYQYFVDLDHEWCSKSTIGQKTSYQRNNPQISIEQRIHPEKFTRGGYSKTPPRKLGL